MTERTRGLDPTPLGHLVRIVDGPADGWSYYVLLEPEPEIMVAPHPTRSGDFMRALDSDPQYPGAHRYRREDPIPEKRTPEGELIVEYRVIDE